MVVIFASFSNDPIKLGSESYVLKYSLKTLDQEVKKNQHMVCGSILLKFYSKSQVLYLVASGTRNTISCLLQFQNPFSILQYHNKNMCEFQLSGIIVTMLSHVCGIAGWTGGNLVSYRSLLIHLQHLETNVQMFELGTLPLHSFCAIFY